MIERIRRCATNLTNRESEQRLKPPTNPKQMRPLCTVALSDDEESDDGQSVHLTELSKIKSIKVIQD